MRLENKIITPRFELVTLDSTFINDQYLAWLNSETVNQYLEARLSPQTQESLFAFVEQMLESPVNYLFAIVDKNSGQHIGNIKLGPINTFHNSAPIGLVIGESEWWGKGVAKEVILAVTDWGFEELHISKLHAGSYASNIGSIRAFLSCGYIVEGKQISQVQLNSGEREDVVLLGKSRNPIIEKFKR